LGEIHVGIYIKIKANLSPVELNWGLAWLAWLGLGPHKPFPPYLFSKSSFIKRLDLVVKYAPLGYRLQDKAKLNLPHTHRSKARNY
jgi:hypothetical protein